jgi:hypothetical protein
MRPCVFVLCGREAAAAISLANKKSKPAAAALRGLAAALQRPLVVPSHLESPAGQLGNKTDHDDRDDDDGPTCSRPIRASINN